MTQIQQERILELQDAGLGYKKIAAELGISVNTVKSFCQRQRLKMYDAFCLQCGNPIQQPPRVRKKKFCSDKCRSMWWNRHPGATPASNDAASDLCMVRQSVRAVRKAQTTILQPCLLRGCQKEGGTRCLILNSVRWLTRQRWRSPAYALKGLDLRGRVR